MTGSGPEAAAGMWASQPQGCPLRAAVGDGWAMEGPRSCEEDTA